MPAKKVPKSNQSSGKATGHYAVATEETRHHEVGQEKRQKIARLHKEEYSADNSHSMSHMEMFRSHAGTKHHQRDLHKAVQHMGISVNVKRNIKAALREKEEPKKLAAAPKMKKPVNLRVNTSSPAIKSPTIQRPFTMSSPRVKTPTVTPDQEAAMSSPSRSSRDKDTNVVKYHATEAGGKW